MPARRGEVFLQTKIAARKGDEARRQIEESLKRLQTDRLDVLHIHALVSLDDLAAIEAKDGVLRSSSRPARRSSRASSASRATRTRRRCRRLSSATTSTACRWP